MNKITRTEYLDMLSSIKRLTYSINGKKNETYCHAILRTIRQLSNSEIANESDMTIGYVSISNNGEFYYRSDTGTLTYKDKEINLTTVEQNIVWKLFCHKNTVVSVDQLMSFLKDQTNKNNNNIAVHIYKLRSKIAKYTDRELIVSKNRGYMIKDVKLKNNIIKRIIQKIWKRK